MSSRVALLVCALCTACVTPLHVESDPHAEALLRHALLGDQGSDALDAFELIGPETRVSFAVARKWDGDRVRVLSYVLQPATADGAAFLLSRAPGWQAEMSWTFPTAGSPRRQTVRRGFALSGGLGGSSQLSLGAEVATPLIVEDYGHGFVGEESIDGQPADIVESRPRQRLRSHTHLRHWISRKSGAELRRVYYDGDAELRRVEIDPADLQAFGSLLRPMRRTIFTADGARNEIVLRNTVPDASLPDSLFSEQTLKIGRFPRF